MFALRKSIKYKYLSSATASKIENKVILLRLDLNVPIRKSVDGRRIVSDSTRIQLLRKTIDFILSYKNTKILIISHLGRPIGRDILLSLNIICDEMKVLGYDISFFDCNLKDNVSRETLSLAFEKHRIVLCENIRFYPQEESNDQNFASQLSKLADVYVNDAFSVSHRMHASIDSIQGFFECVYLGLNFEHEIKSFEKILGESNVKNTRKVAIIGGKKVSTKFGALKVLSNMMDYLIICGAMANTLIAASEEKNLGSSYIEHSMLSEAKAFMKEKKKANLILPSDFVVAKGFGEEVGVKAKALDNIEKEDIIFDVGPKSIEEIKKIISSADLLLWNGPLGYYEDKRFIKSTAQIAEFTANLNVLGKIEAIIGGGDTIAVLSSLKLIEKFSHVSTGGGAFLEYIAKYKDLVL